MSDTSSLLTAILAVQAEVPALPKDGTNPHFHSKFTTLGTVVEKVGPILNKHGLVWTAFPAHHDGNPVLRYRLAHAESGESIEDEMPLLLAKNDSQGFGSAITYARRYSLCAVLNLVADDDDDGNAAGAAGGQQRPVSGRPGRPSDAQKKTLKGLITQKGVSPAQLTVILDTLGVNVEVKEGWLDQLSGGRDGSASALITFLKENPLPDVEHPSDVPGAAPGEFEHEPDDGKGTPMEMLG